MKPEDTKNPWQTLRSSTVYDNPWIEVTHRDVINPGGGESIYGVVHFKNIAIAIIPLDADNNTWLVGQYRYTIDAYSWEIPEGGGLLDSDPLTAAQRELKEETGIIAENWQKISEFAMSNSVTDERAMVYVARDLEFGEAEPEETEDLKIKKVPFNEVVDMVLSGAITDSLTIIAVLQAHTLMQRGEL